MTVPLYPGVPVLALGVGVAIPVETLLTFDDPSALAQSDSVIWGIFDADGNTVLTGDSVRTFEFSNEQRIADYPIEDGGFVSYNKVASPYDIRIMFIQSGSIDARIAFLDDLKATLNDVKLYTVITDISSYDLANIVNIRYRRTAREGATMLSVEVWVQEVREAPATQFSNNTATPDGASQVNDGTVGSEPIPDEKPTPPTATTPGQINVPVESSSNSGLLGGATDALNSGINPFSGTVIENDITPTTSINFVGPLPPDGNPDLFPPGTPVM